MKYLSILSFSLLSFLLPAQPSQTNIHRVLSEVNMLRSEGCNCGGQWMSPVQPVQWNNVLYRVSNKYARYMAANGHFDHVSKSGENLGDRLSNIGYDWAKIGENLGFGYDDFYHVLEAWKKSPSHCRMLMDPDMTDMGLSKHKTYWVQSFSKEPLSIVATSTR